jgi:hypothetical protein
LIKTIAREKEWEERQAQNNAVQWGSSTPGGGWEVTPPASPTFQDGIRRFGPWGVTAEQLAQGGTWPTEEKLYAEQECLHLGSRVLIEVFVEVCSSVGDLTEERTACRCFSIRTNLSFQPDQLFIPQLCRYFQWKLRIL